MTTRNRKKTIQQNRNGSAGSGLTGFLLGGLIGAGVMLLLAPRSGKETREQIQRRTTELRDRAVGGAKATAAEVESRAHELGAQARERVEGLQQKAREAVGDQLDRISKSAEAGKKALNKS